MTISRRRLLQTLAWGGAAALTRATPARAAATPQEWQPVVAAAKKEGKVVVNTFPGDGYKRALKAFTQSYPDIKLEHTGLHSQDFAPRIMQERQASLFTWDVATIPTSTALQVLRRPGCGIRCGRPSCCRRRWTMRAGRAASSAASRR